jgi:hypothetical protein
MKQLLLILFLSITSYITSQNTVDTSKLVLVSNVNIYLDSNDTIYIEYGKLSTVTTKEVILILNNYFKQELRLEEEQAKAKPKKYTTEKF